MPSRYQAALPLVLLVGCSSGTTAPQQPPGSTYDFTQALDNTVGQVIEPTYEELHEAALELQSAADALKETPTEDKLQATRDAWVKARRPWEQSEAFLFGPVASLGIDPSIDSWPVDRVQLDQVLASRLALTAESLSKNFGGGLRGFHTLEYLLWGAEDAKQATAFTERPRELDYLLAAAAALVQDSDTALTAWTEEGGYGAAFAASGTPDGLYARQSDAVQQLLNGMIEICDEVANGKIADPFKAQDRSLEESQFSHNSIRDFADNLRSVKFIYQGARGDIASADSLSAFVRAQDAALDERLNAEIDDAIEAIEAISKDGEPFTTAITNPDKVDVIEAAQSAIRVVMETLQGDVLPLVAR